MTRDAADGVLASLYPAGNFVVASVPFMYVQTDLFWPRGMPSSAYHPWHLASIPPLVTRGMPSSPHRP